ncbi:MAG: MFS transporter [Archangium sp.]|nr:MFS transporter [Archangium sp.]
MLPIVLLLMAVGIVLSRLPKVELGHSPAFKRRRVLNWVPLGLTYAFLYFGRYNFKAMGSELETIGLLTKRQFGDIEGVAAITYGLAFLLNGPLTDRWGGRVTILLAAGGSAVANLGLGFLFWQSSQGAVTAEAMVPWLTLLNAINMYFQSFGAVSIVKVNAPWFHVRERGVLGGLFGILISLGLYFAFDWSKAIRAVLPLPWVFWIPAFTLAGFFLMDLFVIRDSPGSAGFADFDTGDATHDDGGGPPSLVRIAKRMFSQPVIWIIVAVEFCSGYLRQAVMTWGPNYAKSVGQAAHFVFANWGLVSCVAGILGGVFAGFISDHLFGSRRGPVATVLYVGLLTGAVTAFVTMGGVTVGWSVAFMSLCVIGVHGMLSGTASMDFGGKKGAGIATGIIDGFVYLGSASQSFIFGRILPKDLDAKDPANWSVWPLAMIPVAVLGLGLATRVWNARPRSNTAAH